MADVGTAAGAEGTTLWRAMRSEPLRASELVVPYALPILAQHIEGWYRALRARHPDDSPEQLAGRVARRSVGVARRSGAVSGSSLYVGTLPAMAVIFCEQLTMMLRIARIFGRDPTDPARIAEILVIQERYRSVDEAAAAMHAIVAGSGKAAATEARRRRRVADVGSALWEQLRHTFRHPIESIVLIAGVLSFVVPVLSIPAWTLLNTRATRRLSRSAIGLYRDEPGPTTPPLRTVYAKRHFRADRRVAFAALVLSSTGIGILMAVLPVDRYHRLLAVLVILGGACFLASMARLVWITRLQPGSGHS